MSQYSIVRKEKEHIEKEAAFGVFGISNTIYRNKRMEPDKVLRIFDSLISPIALYACPVWLPFDIKKNIIYLT